MPWNHSGVARLSHVGAQPISAVECTSRDDLPGYRPLLWYGLSRNIRSDIFVSRWKHLSSVLWKYLHVRRVGFGQFRWVQDVLTMRYVELLISYALLSVHSTQVLSQSRNDQWFIGLEGWVSFQGGTPANLAGLPAYLSTTASIATPNGDLVLYCTPQVLRNGTMQLVPGTAGLITSLGGGQSNLILPWPNDPDRAAVFSVTNQSSLDPHSGYFEVDLTMNNGSGGTNDTLVRRLMEGATPPSSKLTAVPHANGSDYWVLMHQRNSAAYHAFRFGPAGVDSVPVVSVAGAVHGPALYYGCLKASYDGSLLAMSAYSVIDTCRVDVLGFDDTTGDVVGLCSLPGFRFAQGVEFSPGGSKLYVTDQYNTPWSIQQELWQYDLSSLDCAAIENSKTLIRRDSSQSGNGTPLKVLAQGPDGKIYYRHFWKHNYLGVVNDPDESGVACNYVQDGYLTLNDTLLSITNQCKRYHDSEMPWTLGVREVPGPERAQVWPVPMHNEGWLRLAPGHVFDVLLWTDATGRSVRTTTNTPVNGLALQPEGLAPGVYTVRALLKGAVVGVGTVVKE